MHTVFLHCQLVLCYVRVCQQPVLGTHCKARKNHTVPCFSTAEGATGCSGPWHHHQRGGLPLGSADGAHWVVSSKNREWFSVTIALSHCAGQCVLCQPCPLVIGLLAYQPGMASVSELLFFLFSFPYP